MQPGRTLFRSQPRWLIATAPTMMVVLAGIVLTALPAAAQEAATRIHGPFITWDTDPLTTANIVWVESPVGGNRRVVGTWKEGEAGFGFGDDDDNTELDEMRDRFQRLYIRREFQLPEPLRDERVTLQIRYDDAFVAYLNGREVLREGVESGRGWEAEGIDSHEADEDEYDSFVIDAWDELARVGENVLAIEVHNRDIDSSDLTLDAYLTAGREPDSKAIIPRHAQWHYMADGDAPTGWTTIDFPELRDEPRAVTARDEDNSDANVSSASDDPSFHGALFVRRRGTQQWTRHQAIERPFGSTRDKVFWGLLTDLEPGTEYEFVVRQAPEQATDAILRFRTAPQQPGEMFRFVSGGDMGSTRIARAMTSMAAGKRPQFALIGGDIAYANGRNLRAWHNWIDDWRRHAITPDGLCVPMIIAIGNHETGSDLDAERADELLTHKDAMFFYSLFPLLHRQPFYAVDFADYLSVIVLDSNHTVPASEQARWLRHALAERTDPTHVFICYHRPAYGTAKDPDMEVRKHWVPLWEQYPITAVFENDHHTLKRTHRLLNGKRDPNGVLYLGDGAWGVETRDVPEPGEVEYLAHAASENHVWVVDLQGQRATYRALDEDGKVLDQVTTDGKQ